MFKNSLKQGCFFNLSFHAMILCGELLFRNLSEQSFLKDEAVGTWDVRPDKHQDRFGKVTSTPENTLDKDGDGVVTCDEYYGVTGLKWDATKNACVTTSGNAVVTVPNTSAR